MDKNIATFSCFENVKIKSNLSSAVIFFVENNTIKRCIIKTYTIGRIDPVLVRVITPDRGIPACYINTLFLFSAEVQKNPMNSAISLISNTTGRTSGLIRRRRYKRFCD
jgi:hypothetical protein